MLSGFIRFELIRSFLFRTLVLLPFRLCLDHSFKELPLNNLPLFLQHRSRCFASAKVLLFPFPPTLFQLFFIYFSIIFHLAEKQCVTEAVFASFREKQPFSARFSLFFEDYRRFLSRKISQNRKIMTKTDAFWTSFLLLEKRTVHDFGDGNGVRRRSLEYLIN